MLQKALHRVLKLLNYRALHALEIFSICVTNGTILDVQWVPGDLNHVSDEISKIIDFDDDTVHDEGIRIC